MQTALRRPLTGSRVHLVGIGGAGMAALAELLIGFGYVVSGSDLKGSRVTARLQGVGARVHIGPHRASSASGAEHVIVSAAVPAGNPEAMRAAELGVDVLSRAELLGRIFDAGRGVAVSGTHGKTTTSSMLARALEAAGFGPSFVIGGDLNDIGSGARLGSSDIVVAEADEAFGSFLCLRPEMAVVTNIDRDHLDHYSGQEAIDDAFDRFLSARRPGGAAVVSADDPGVARLRPRIASPVVTFGTTGADLTVSPTAGAHVVTWRGSPVGTLRPAVPGRHNVLNAAAAAAAALTLGAEPRTVVEALSTFPGVERRFSVRGRERDVVVIDDYAHNPAKVSATLAAAREAYPGSRIVALFQPHLYSRTLQLAEDFGSAFEDADVVVVTEVYGAREDSVPGVSGRLVSDAIRRRSRTGTVASFVPRLDEAAGFVAGLAQAGDVVITLGAGDVTAAAPRILAMLRSDERGPES